MSNPVGMDDFVVLNHPNQLVVYQPPAPGLRDQFRARIEAVVERIRNSFHRSENPRIEAKELSLPNQKMLKRILEDRTALLQPPASTSSNSVIGSTTRFLTSTMGENAAINYSSVLSGAVITAYVAVCGPASPLLAAVQTHALRLLYSETLLQTVWRPAGVKAGETVGQLINYAGSKAGEKVRERLKIGAADSAKLNQLVSRQNPQWQGEPLCEADLQAINQLIVTTDLVLRILGSSRGEMKETLFETTKRREDGKTVWIDGSFLRSESDLELSREMKQFGIIQDGDHEGTLNAAASILSRTNPDAARTEQVVKNAFDLIAFFVSRKASEPLLDACKIVRCEDGEFMNWEDGAIFTTEKVVSVANDKMAELFPPGKELNEAERSQAEAMEAGLAEFSHGPIIEEIDSDDEASHERID